MVRPRFQITDDGDGTWPSPMLSPSQFQLSNFLRRHGETLNTLTISLEGFPSTVEGMLSWHVLSLARCPLLKNLKRLVLRGIRLRRGIELTESITPCLQELHLSLLSSEKDAVVNFNLDLPELRKLSVESVTMGDGDFGLSLSRCRKLEQVKTYKFCFLHGDNFMVLPRCKVMELHRSECTDSVEILSAPLLTNLDIQSSFNLSHLRVWDLEQEVGVDDVKWLKKEMAKERRAVTLKCQAWEKKWKTGQFTADDAVSQNWIEPEERDKFDVESDIIKERMGDHFRKMFDWEFSTLRTRVWDAFRLGISRRDNVITSHQLPDCTVSCENVVLHRESRGQLDQNVRVTRRGGGNPFELDCYEEDRRFSSEEDTEYSSEEDQDWDEIDSMCD